MSSPPGASPAGTPATALSRSALARAATAPADAAAAGAPASPLSPRGNGAPAGGTPSSLRTSFDGHPAQRPQRWYLQTGGAATEASEAAEPLLSGYSQELPVGTPRSVNPYGAGTPASNKASAAAAAVAARGGSLAPGGELVAVARDVTGQERGTDLSRALVFGMINAVATIPALVAYAAIVFKVTRRRGERGRAGDVVGRRGEGAGGAVALCLVGAWSLILLRCPPRTPMLPRRTPFTPPTWTSSASFSSSAPRCTRPCSVC